MNFNNIGSLGNRSMPTPSLAWGAAPNEWVDMIQDPREALITHNNKDPSNSMNNNTFKTNSMDLEARMSWVIGKEL